MRVSIETVKNIDSFAWTRQKNIILRFSNRISILL